MTHETTLQHSPANARAPKIRRTALVAIVAMVAAMLVTVAQSPTVAKAETCAEFLRDVALQKLIDPNDPAQVAAMNEYYDQSARYNQWRNRPLNTPEGLWAQEAKAYLESAGVRVQDLTTGQFLINPPKAGETIRANAGSAEFNSTHVRGIWGPGDTGGYMIIEGNIDVKTPSGTLIEGPARRASEKFDTDTARNKGYLRFYIPDGLATKAPPKLETLGGPWLKSGKGTIEVIVTDPSAQSLPHSGNSIGELSLFAPQAGIAPLPANTTWKAIPESSWVTVSPTTGPINGKFTVTVQPNPTQYDRETVVRVELSNGTASWLPVRQARPAVTYTSSATGSTQSTTVTWNAPSWSATSDATWATLDKTSGQGTGTYSFKLSATTTPNTTGATRTATITIRYEGYWQEHQIVITQPPIKASTFSWTPGSGGGTYTLKGTPNAAWTAELSAPWVTASPSSGTGAATMLALTATPNTATSPRTATATVKAYGVPLWVVNITQGAASSTTASALSLTPGASGGTHTITGTPNAAWTASSSEPWVTTTPSTGTGAATAIKLTIAANTDAAARTATVTVKANSGATIWVVNVTQAGAQAEQEDVWTVGPYGWTSPATIPVTTTKAWTVTASAPWVAVSPGSGTGNASIKVNPAPNPSTAPRSATVTVKIAGVTTDVITINQSAAPPPVATTWTAGAAGWSSPGTLNWSTSLDWTAAASAEWVTVTPGSGKGNASIKVNVTKNTSKAARSATVTVKIGGAVAEVLTINQSG